MNGLAGCKMDVQVRNKNIGKDFQKLDIMFTFFQSFLHCCPAFQTKSSLYYQLKTKNAEEKHEGQVHSHIFIE